MTFFVKKRNFSRNVWKFNIKFRFKYKNFNLFLFQNELTKILRLSVVKPKQRGGTVTTDDDLFIEPVLQNKWQQQVSRFNQIKPSSNNP
jgi:hypothetical protein